MIGPEEALLIGMFCGLAVGYSAGFFMSRMIYRSPNWPRS